MRLSVSLGGPQANTLANLHRSASMLREHGTQRPTVFQLLEQVHLIRGTKSRYRYVRLIVSLRWSCLTLSRIPTPLHSLQPKYPCHLRLSPSALRNNIKRNSLLLRLLLNKRVSRSSMPLLPCDVVAPSPQMIAKPLQHGAATSAEQR